MVPTANLECLNLDLVVGKIEVQEHDDIGYSVVILRSLQPMRIIDVLGIGKRWRSIVGWCLDSQGCSVTIYQRQ